jgi:integrase
LSAALKSDEPRVKMAVHLLYYTAQRIGDVCKMTWGDVRDGTVAVTQDKTNKRLAIRLHQELRNLLAETPKRGITILTTEHGHPVSPKTIREELKAFAAGYGVKIVPHGLRKNAVIALLEAGCTVAEAASVSGQSFQMVEYYAELRDQRLLSSAAILKWEGRT